MSPVSRRNMDPVRGLVPYHHVRFRAPCNLRCFFCYERPHTPVDPTGQLKAIRRSLERAREAGYSVVAFGSGELMLLQGWEKAVEFAVELGFEGRYLLTNLSQIDASTVPRLVGLGLTGVGGTVSLLSDEQAFELGGMRGLPAHQFEALRLLAAEPGLDLSLHVILTRPIVGDLAKILSGLPERIGAPIGSVMLSAIEPISAAVGEHPLYTDGLDLPWERIFEALADAGMEMVVQNLPACALGRFAHRSFFLRRRVARILAGWPERGDLALEVNTAEDLRRRNPATGDCDGCPLISVCHRYFDYRKTRRPDERDDEQVVRALCADEELTAEPAAITRALRFLDSRSTHDESAPPR
jgi:hypothetical protein